MAHIMIVDDDPNIRRLLVAILEDEGHTVEEAEDGQTALRHYAGRPSDLVLCDVYMPQMNGIEFVMRVREAFPEAKIIGLSGGGFLAGRTVLEAIQNVGAIGVLEKPFGVENVVQAVEDALGAD